MGLTAFNRARRLAAAATPAPVQAPAAAAAPELTHGTPAPVEPVKGAAVRVAKPKPKPSKE